MPTMTMKTRHDVVQRRAPGALWSRVPSSIAALCAATALATSGCGGGGGGGSVSTILPIVTDDHSSTITAISSAYDSLPHLSDAADATALLAYVLTLPDVAAAGSDAPGNVWYRFSDGVIATISTISLGQGPSTTATAVATPTPALGPNVNRQNSSLPSGRKAFVIDSASSTIPLPSPADDIARRLEAQGYNTVKSSGPVSLDLFRLVNNASVLHLTAHGGTAETLDRKKVYMLSTNVPCDDKTQVPRYAVEIFSKYSVGLMSIAPPHKPGTPPAASDKMTCVLSIGPRFIEDNMSFSKDSLVVLAVCEGGAPSAGPAAIRKSLFKQGASIIVGWDNLVQSNLANDTSQYLFDRLLSSNDYVLYQVPPDAPPNRPFTLMELFAAMAGKVRALGAYKQDGETYGIVGDQKLTESALWDTGDNAKYVITHAKLTYQVNGGDLSWAGVAPLIGAAQGPGLYGAFGLVPSITSVSMDNTANTILVVGHFGDGPDAAGAGTRQVTLGGTVQQVKAWSPSVIQLQNVPTTGAGSDGELVVSVDGSSSNKALINRWSDLILSNFTADQLPGVPTTGDGGAYPKTVVACTIQIRASSRGFRAAPDGDYKAQPTSSQVVTDAGSHCAYTAGGTYSGATSTVTWSTVGNGLLNWLTAAQQADRITPISNYDPYAYVTGPLSSSGFVFSMSAHNAGDSIKQITTFQSPPSTATGWLPLADSGATTSSNPAVLNSFGDIVAGQYQQTLNLFTWSSATAKYRDGPPYDKTQAR